MIAFTGQDVSKFLNTRDNLDRAVMLGIAEEVLVLRNREDKNLSVLIANAVGKMLSGK